MSTRKTTTRRVRDPEARRADILAAARSVFGEQGYAKATLREIAQRAGVTHGLIVRHFATKEQLFHAAVPSTRDLAENIPGDVEGLAERVARAYVARMEHGDGADPFKAIIRSVASGEEAAKALLCVMRDTSIETYRNVLDGDDVPQRVDLLGAHLIGLTFSRYVLAAGPVAEMTPEELIRYLTSTVEAILLGPPASVRSP